MEGQLTQLDFTEQPPLALPAPAQAEQPPPAEPEQPKPVPTNRPKFWMPERDPERKPRNMGRELADFLGRQQAKRNQGKETARFKTARQLAAEADGVDQDQPEQPEAEE